MPVIRPKLGRPSLGCLHPPSCLCQYPVAAGLEEVSLTTLSNPLWLPSILMWYIQPRRCLCLTFSILKHLVRQAVDIVTYPCGNSIPFQMTWNTSIYETLIFSLFIFPDYDIISLRFYRERWFSFCAQRTIICNFELLNVLNLIDYFISCPLGFQYSSISFFDNGKSFIAMREKNKQVDEQINIQTYKWTYCGFKCIQLSLFPY